MIEKEKKREKDNLKCDTRWDLLILIEHTE